jgi:regulator of protease activity HflC (stomatin/prohibitin superfamily)
MNNIKFGFVLILIIGAVLAMSTFIVHEREVAIKFKLGEIVESSHNSCLNFSGSNVYLLHVIVFNVQIVQSN